MWYDVGVNNGFYDFGLFVGLIEVFLMMVFGIVFFINDLYRIVVKGGEVVGEGLY